MTLCELHLIYDSKPKMLNLCRGNATLLLGFGVLAEDPVMSLLGPLIKLYIIRETPAVPSQPCLMSQATERKEEMGSCDPLQVT